MAHPSLRSRITALATIALVSASLLTATPAAATSPVGPGTYEETSSAIAYTGTWYTLNSGGASGGSLRYATGTASATLTFTGAEITWYTWNTASAGKVQVYVDGVLKKTVDNYSSRTATNIVGYSQSGLSAGTHTITIKSSGTANAASAGKITHLDSFVVGAHPESASPPAPEPPTNGSGVYEETSPEIEYTGAWTSLNSSGSSGGAIRYSSGISASASLTFTGGDVTWYTWQSASAGRVEVWLDGVLQTTVDNYSPTTKTMVRAFTAQDLTPGTHTITIKASGKANPASSSRLTHVDAFVVGGPESGPLEAPAVRASDCPAPTQVVSTSAELTTALASAGPGTVIHLAPGTYSRGFMLSASGTPDAPIWVCGPRSAVLEGVSTSSGTALRIENAAHVNVAGFTVTNALQGVMTKFSSHVSVSDLHVKDTGYEAIHLYAFTSDSYVLGNLIERPGAVDVAYGEGVYIGTSQRRWGEVTGGVPDASDRNVVAWNTIVDAGAEPIEAKEGTSDGLIRENSLLGNRSGSRSIAWVLVTGNDWSVIANNGSRSIQHGYAGMVWGDWGKRNDFRENTGTVSASGFGVWIQQSASQSTAACDNWVSGAASGQTNVYCTP